MMLETVSIADFVRAVQKHCPPETEVRIATIEVPAGENITGALVILTAPFGSGIIINRSVVGTYADKNALQADKIKALEEAKNFLSKKGISFAEGMWSE